MVVLVEGEEAAPEKCLVFWPQRGYEAACNAGRGTAGEAGVVKASGGVDTRGREQTHQT